MKGDGLLQVSASNPNLPWKDMSDACSAYERMPELFLEQNQARDLEQMLRKRRCHNVIQERIRKGFCPRQHPEGKHIVDKTSVASERSETQTIPEISPVPLH